MTPGRSRLPSAGFLLIGLVYALLAAFLGWGSATPDLDRIWTLRHGLKIGKIAHLPPADQRLMLDAIARHPPLLRALLDGRPIGLLSENSEGWISTPTATVLRTKDASAGEAIVLEVQTPRDLLPIELRVQGQSCAGESWRRKIAIASQGELRLELPQAPELAELIELRLIGKGLKADPSVLGLRVRFEGTRP